MDAMYMDVNRQKPLPRGRIVLKSTPLHRIASSRVAAVLLLLVIGSSQSWAQFSTPKVIKRITPEDTGALPDSVLNVVSYYIDSGTELNINPGDWLNVYRERLISRQVGGLRMLIGRMLITDSQAGISVGVFEPSEEALSHPLIRVKSAMKGDMVIPLFNVDSSVLFAPKLATLKLGGAAKEFAKFADFVKMFSPTKIVIEGHTDSDGDPRYNRILSASRAKSVGNYLVTNYADITVEMVETHGYGDERPIAPNDTPENKKLNQRIEVIVWN